MPEFYKHWLLRPFALLSLIAFYIYAFPVPACAGTNKVAIVLAAPTIQAKPSLVGAITVTWSTVSGATGYVLEMSQTGAEGTFVPLKTFDASTNTYRHTGLYYNQRVYYRIKATSSGEQSPYSSTVSATTHAQSKVFNIMPLGDSNTEGGAEADPVNSKAAYRSKLEDLLKADGVQFDYVGSEASGSSFVADDDHAGFGGARNNDLVTILQNGYYYRWYDGVRFGLDHQENYLDHYKPDVILLHSGTNEISNDGVDNSQQAADELGQILDEVDKYEQRTGKEVTVIVAQIIKTVCTATDCYGGPVYTKNDIIDKYNAKVEALVKSRIKAGDRLELVDMADANLVYLFASDGGDMADRFHPILKGYDKMAPVWYNVLDGLLNRTLTPTDTQAPETNITSKPAAQSNSKTATFSFSSNEAGVIYQVSLDGAPFAPANNPYTTVSLADGAHTIQVRAVDQAGNIDPTPATYTWTIDTKAPAAPIVVAPEENALLNMNKPTISGTAEAGSTVTVSEGSKVIGTATAGTNGNWSLVPGTALTEGTQKVAATAKDAAGNNSSASAIRSFTVDTQAPETTIVSGPPAVSTNKNASFTFSSNESNVVYQVSINGAAFKEVTNPYQLSALTDGAYEIKVRAVDAAGNTDATPASYKWVIDTKAPDAPVIATVSEDRGPVADDRITSDNKIRLAGKAEAEATVTVSDEQGKIGETKANAAGDWVLNYEATTLTEGTHQFTATATDAAGNISTQSNAFTVEIDLNPPQVNIATNSASPVNSAFEISITFSEDVYGLAAADFDVVNGSVSELKATDAAAYTALVIPAANGTVRVVLPAGKTTDLAGNLNSASAALEVLYDGTGPEVVLTSEAPVMVNAPFKVTFSFNEPITGFTSEDVSLTNATISDFAATGANTFTAQIIPATDGEVTVRVAAEVAFDEAGNGNSASAILRRTYDVQKPEVVLQTSAPDPTNAPFTVTIAFNEAITEFALADIAVSNGAASLLKNTTDNAYTVLITPAQSGEVEISMAAGVVTDLAGNGNTASNKIIVEYDSGRPAVTLSSSVAAFTNEPFTVTISISEDVNDFELADLALVNAAAKDLEQVSPQEYKVLISPLAEGAVRVSLPAEKIHDAAGNGNTASNALETKYDATAPAAYTVAFAVEEINVTNQEQVSFSVSNAEEGATYTYKISSSNGEEEVTGSGVVAKGAFTISDLNLSQLSDGTITLAFYLVDEAGNKGPEVTDQVQKLTRNIVTVSAVSPLKVPFRTTFEQLELPEKVQVTYANGETEALQVNWEKGSYNGSVAGQYDLKGILVLAPKSTNTNNKTATVTVEVEPNQAPTALRFSSTTFKPDTRPDETIGHFSTTDPDDAEFTYALVAGQGDEHNGLFEIMDDALYLRSNKGLSGITNFTIRVRSTDPYQNSIESTFTLQKSLYQGFQKIELVNAFSPDGDGINDTWRVPELRYFNDVEIEVFDRSGTRLFHSTNPEEGWNGQGRDGRIVEGSYFYIIQVKEISLVQKGVVTILK